MTVVASGYDRQPNDLYETPAWVTLALLRHFPVVAGASLWEPAAGNHKMADVLREAGAAVYASDVQRYARPHDQIFDFLDERAPSPPTFNAIVTNPPYGKGNRLAAKFCRLALARCPDFVAILCTAKFDFGKTRADLFADNYRFAAKIALVDRIQWFEGDHQGTEDHAWYVWGQAGFYRGPARILYAGREGR